MTLNIAIFTSGIYKTNCYIVANSFKEALIIDPGYSVDEIVNIITSNEWRPIAILCTHGHFDHVGVVANLMEHFDIPFFLNGKDAALLSRMNLYRMIIEPGPGLRVPTITRDLMREDSLLKLNEFRIKVIFTPGHTPGGVCFQIENHLFTGDTILPAGVGRIDLPGGDAKAMAQSLKLLSTLPENLLSHPGHGEVMRLNKLLAQGLAATSFEN